MKPKDIRNNITQTYQSIRFGLGILALAFPPLLWLGGLLRAGLHLQDSMSAYYHAYPHPDNLPPGQILLGNGVMRDEFVGILFAVGIFLFLYQGITRLEEIALRIAGIAAVCIAIFPMAWGAQPPSQSYPHGISAICFFLCIAYVSIFRSSDTLPLVPNPLKRDRYRHLYKTLGMAMASSPLIACVLSVVFNGGFRSYTYWVEVAGIYAFSFYWLLKGKEFQETETDKKAARGELAVPPHGARDTFRVLPVQKQVR